MSIRLSLLFLFCAACLLLCGCPKKVSSQSAQQPTPTPTPNKPANVTGINLSKSEVFLPCPPGQQPSSGSCNDDMSINVVATATDTENDPLIYNYTVSGGRIMGRGANVTWDLTGARPGSYTITVGVDDGAGVLGETKTATAQVSECNCGSACSCPMLSVTGPSSETPPGKSITFSANLAGGNQEGGTYNWTVSAGTIIEGQGTPTITVATTSEMADSSITATVEIGGLCAACGNTTASQTAVISVGFFHGDVTGRVIRATGNTGIPNAAVELIFKGQVKATTTTNGSGNYSFDGISAPETYTIRATKNGKQNSGTVNSKVDQTVVVSAIRLSTQ